jgi:choice-of-anchor C domain-containing protein
MRCKYLGLVVLFVFATTAHVQAALLTNPSFEQPVVGNPDFNYYYAGNPAITGWTIVGGSVDLLSTNWKAHDGNQSIDLAGVTPGGLYQDVSTTPGQSYRLGFWLAGNPEFPGSTGPVVKTAKVSWGGNSVANVSFDTTGKSKTNLGWTFYSYDLTATAATTRLQFDNTSSGSSGALIDDLSLVQLAPPSSVPLPPGLLPGALTAGTLFIARRRSKR